MNSPINSDVKLVRSDLEVGLGCWKCPHSGGFWIAAPDYWVWHSHLPMDEKSSLPAMQELKPDSDFVQKTERQALICPESRSLMVRYKVGGLGVFVDRSPLSGGIWLDAGVWELLKKNNIHVALHEVFGHRYQRRVWREEAELALKSQFYEDVGEDVLAELQPIIERLKNHPKRRRILAWFYEQLMIEADGFDSSSEDEENAEPEIGVISELIVNDIVTQNE